MPGTEDGLVAAYRMARCRMLRDPARLSSRFPFQPVRAVLRSFWAEAQRWRAAGAPLKKRENHHRSWSAARVAYW